MTERIIIILLTVVIYSCSNNRQADRFDPKALELDSKAADLTMNGKEDSALILYDQALQIDSTYYPAYNNKANIYLNKGFPDSAIIQLEKTLKLKPDFAEIWSFVGMLYDNKGDTLKAKRYYEKSITLYTVRIENPDRTSKKDITRSNRLNRAYNYIFDGQVQKGRTEAIQLKKEDANNIDSNMLNDMLTKTRQEILNEFTKK